MNLTACLTGIHPFKESTIQTIFDYKYGRSTKIPLEKSIVKDLKDLTNQMSIWQYISTGNLGWFDLLRPFTEHLSEGLIALKKADDLPVTRNPLTNTFYRQPMVIGKLKSNKDVLEQKHPIYPNGGYLQADLLPVVEKEQKRTQILPGPFYFACMVNYSPEGRQVYPSAESCATAFADILIQEINMLQMKGFNQIVLDESPISWAVKTGEKLPQSVVDTEIELLNQIVDQTKAKIISHYHNGSITQIPENGSQTLLEVLLDSRIHGIGIDFFSSPLTEVTKQNFDDKTLFAGLIDATGYNRSSDGVAIIDNRHHIKKSLMALKDTEASELVLCPSTRLELIPRSIADQKVELMTSIIQEVTL